MRIQDVLKDNGLQLTLNSKRVHGKSGKAIKLPERHLVSKGDSVLQCTGWEFVRTAVCILVKKDAFSILSDHKVGKKGGEE